MSRQDRAKQFLPFGALKGYPEALRREEKRTRPRAELPEDRQEELDRELRRLQAGEQITVVYYCRGEYRKMTGMAAKTDRESRILQVEETGIPFADLYFIQREGGDEPEEC